MLKSTYKPSERPQEPSLPPGWTEHKAPTGHTYYYHAETKQSTYTRPGAAPDAPQQQPRPQLNLSDPNVANAFLAQYNRAEGRSNQRGGFRGGRGGANNGFRPQPHDKPISKHPIPGCEPWFLVFTKYGRRFAYNSAKSESFWRIPDKLKAGILQLDQERINKKAGLDEDKSPDEQEPKSPAGALGGGDGPSGEQIHEDDGSEYEEVEVTDDEEGEGATEEEGDDEEEDEGEADESGQGRAKRQRTGSPAEEEQQTVEFNEADIAYQLQAMGEEYGLEPGEYDDGNMEEWPEGAEGLVLSDEDARALFWDLLNDFGVNPYSPWEKLIEEGKIFNDSRYTALNTMKARKEAWEEWSREKLKELKAQRAKEEKKDPRIPYMAFLQARASPKLYWPEFKRKYRKEEAMRDAGLADKDREKWYREHISRLKLPLATLRSDLTTLLKSMPLSKLNNQTLPTHLPAEILTDIRYISLDPAVRDPLFEAYIQTLSPPPQPEQVQQEEAGEAAMKAKEERRRREQALEERERAVAEEKRRSEKKLRVGQAMLRDEERELQRAMQVGKGGLQSQLAGHKDSVKQA